MFVENVIQHGVSSLRATATESFIELVDAFDMLAFTADEDYAARASVDRVHDAEHTRQFFRLGVMAITFWLPMVLSEAARTPEPFLPLTLGAISKLVEMSICLVPDTRHA